MVTHINKDTTGNEFRIYAALAGCGCGYCEDQRRRAAKHYAASTDMSSPDWSECGRMLDALAQQIMQTQKILYGQAFSLACEKFPAVSAVYSAGETGTESATPAKDSEPRERERTYTHDSALRDFNDTQKWRGAAGELLDEKTKEIMKERGIKNYAQALNIAMSENPTLAERYNK